MKKSKLLITPLLVIPFLASCNSGNKTEEYPVEIQGTNGVDISSHRAIKGQDYIGTIEIDVLKIKDKILPNALDKVTSGNKDLLSADYTYTLKKDKVSADFIIPAEKVVGNIVIQLTLVNKPEPEPTDPHVVTEQEFKDAVTFKDVQYLQATEVMYNESSEPNFYYKKEMSPSVFYYLGSEKPINTTNEDDYHEEYCRKRGTDPIIYDWCRRTDPEGVYNFESGSEYSDKFFNPQSFSLAAFDATLAELLEVCLNPDFCSSFGYIKEQGVYKADITTYYYKIHIATIILKFENKKNY